MHYNCGLAGEASARHHLRTPQFIEAHCLRLVKGALGAAGNLDVFPDGHLFVMCDGKAHSNVENMQKCFQDSASKALSTSQKRLYAMAIEDSERETKDRLCGATTLPTMEITTLFTQQTLSIPYKKRLRCSGSNASDTLGPLQRQKKSELWCVTHAMKSKLHGPSLEDVSGKVEGDAGVGADPDPKGMSSCH